MVSCSSVFSLTRSTSFDDLNSCSAFLAFSFSVVIVAAANDDDDDDVTDVVDVVEALDFGLAAGAAAVLALALPPPKFNFDCLPPGVGTLGLPPPKKACESDCFFCGPEDMMD